MQAQDGPAEIFFKLWPTLEKNKNLLIGAGVAIVAGAGVWYFVSSQRAQNEVDAGLALTTLSTSTTARQDSSQMSGQYQQLAAKYSGTAAGQRAQLQGAAALFDAGNFADALTQFQKFLDANSTGPLAAVAELGIAASLQAQEKLDPAAAAYQRVVSLFPDSICVQQAQFSLGFIAEKQGKFSEALNHYQDVGRSGTGGTVVQEAMLRAADLKTKMAAAAPKPTASAMPTATPAKAPVTAPITAPQPATKP